MESKYRRKYDYFSKISGVDISIFISPTFRYFAKNIWPIKSNEEKGHVHFFNSLRAALKRMFTCKTCPKRVDKEVAAWTSGLDFHCSIYLTFSVSLVIKQEIPLLLTTQQKVRLRTNFFQKPMKRDPVLKVRAEEGAPIIRERKNISSKVYSIKKLADLGGLHYAYLHLGSSLCTAKHKRFVDSVQMPSDVAAGKRLGFVHKLMAHDGAVLKTFRLLGFDTTPRLQRHKHMNSHIYLYRSMWKESWGWFV